MTRANEVRQLLALVRERLSLGRLLFEIVPELHLQGPLMGLARSHPFLPFSGIRPLLPALRARGYFLQEGGGRGRTRGSRHFRHLPRTSLREELSQLGHHARILGQRAQARVSEIGLIGHLR